MVLLFNNELEIVWDFNLWEFLYAFVGAFFGFFSALFLDNHFEKRKVEKRKEEIIKNIFKELKLIEEALAKLKGNSPIEFRTPCYTALVQSGDLLLFVEDKLYESLLNVYFYINDLNDQINKRNRQTEVIGKKEATEKFLKAIEQLNYPQEQINAINSFFSVASSYYEVEKNQEEQTS